MYGKTTYKISVPVDKSFNPIDQTFFKGICWKIQRKCWNFIVLHFLKKIAFEDWCQQARTNLSSQDGSFDTHIDIVPNIFLSYGICHKMPKKWHLWHFMIFYDICHMIIFAINHVNIGTVLIRQISFVEFDRSFACCLSIHKIMGKCNAFYDFWKKVIFWRILRWLFPLWPNIIGGILRVLYLFQQGPL